MLADDVLFICCCGELAIEKEKRERIKKVNTEIEKVVWATVYKREERLGVDSSALLM